MAAKRKNVSNSIWKVNQNLVMRITKTIIYIYITTLFCSCCLTIKEEYLGNDLYLSEYDNVDRRILYSKERCSGSGVEIVPMTVIEIAYDTKWIIAKSGSRDGNSNIQYWIIKNDYSNMPTDEIIKTNMFGPLDFETFKSTLKEKKINLELKKIE